MTSPTIVQRKPFVLTLQPGKIAWCSCGKSQNQPYCDGSHRGSEFRPVIVEITEEKKAALCRCKHSANKPYCDGAHSKLP